MKNILLCSSDPLLIKNLYGVLRDEGFAVKTVEHPALAVQTVIGGTVDALVVDSEPFGLSAEDAVQIIRSVKPDLPVLFVGNDRACGVALGVETPLDLALIKSAIHSIAV
jgi:DNA-binding response OmpR family regulator